MTGRVRLRRAHFEGLYARDPDPWGFATSDYERAKYARTLAVAVPGAPVGSAFEAGCSIGVFSALLASRCERLLAVDVSRRALDVARVRLAGRPGVRLERRTLPEELPRERFDLAVFSEVLYYWDRATLQGALEPIAALIAEGGALVAVHWRRATRTYPLGGDEVHETLAAGLALRLVHREQTADYRLDRFER